MNPAFVPPMLQLSFNCSISRLSVWRIDCEPLGPLPQIHQGVSLRQCQLPRRELRRMWRQQPPLGRTRKTTQPSFKTHAVPCTGVEFYLYRWSTHDSRRHDHRIHGATLEEVKKFLRQKSLVIFIVQKTPRPNGYTNFTSGLLDVPGIGGKR